MAKSLKIRSWLVVEPSADAATVHSAQADVTVLDLTGDAESRNAAGDFCRAWAETSSAPPAFLLPAFPSARTDAAVEIAVRCGAGSVVLTGVRGGGEVQRLDMALRVAEIRAGQVPGKTRITALADAAGVLSASTFERCSARLMALGWEGGYGNLSDTARFAAAAIVLAASVADAAAIDAMSAEGDETTFRIECQRAKADGFSGKLCRSIRQIPIINQVF